MAEESGPANMSSSTVKARFLPLFTTALKTYQLSNKTFAVLCSLPASSSAGVHGRDDLQPSPPTQTPRSLLVLDSSFNPPTVAHHRMVLAALADYSKSNKEEGEKNSQPRILLLLAINNADKAPKPAAFPQRLAMMYIFAQDLLASQEALESNASGVDIAVTTEPYFHAKSAAVQESGFYSGIPRGGGQRDGRTDKDTSSSIGPQQIYLTGFDTLIRIFNPKYYPNETMSSVLNPFFAHSGLRVTMRTDGEWGGLEEQVGYFEELRRGKLEDVGGRGEWARKIEMVEGRKEGEEAVSSTKVRDAVKRKDWEKLEGLVSKSVAEWVREEVLYVEDANK